MKQKKIKQIFVIVKQLFRDATIAIKVLKKYRKKNSLFFLIYHTLIKSNKLQYQLPSELLIMMGIPKRDIKMITRIYYGLKAESGKVVAIAACMEITREARL